MKRTASAFILFLLTLSLFSQNPTTTNMASTINLQGHASGKFAPDLMVIDFTVLSRNKTHQTALAQMQQASADLVTRLNKMGFTKEQIKLTAYNVNQEFDYSDNRQRLKGYVASQSLHLEFKTDMAKLSTVFKSFADAPSQDISYNYGTDFSKDLKEKIRTELLPAAIREAQSKAELIASTAKLKITGIKDISYNVAVPVPAPMFMRAMAMKEENADAAGVPDVSINETEFMEDIQIIYLAEMIR